MTPKRNFKPQIAALPLRLDEKGRLNVLMVTSRDTGRWVMPKGWLMDGKTPWAAAAIEALEEAGAEGKISKTAIGAYNYAKTGADGTSVPCRVTVYPMTVKRLHRRWKERDQRSRRWFRLRAAARRVAEPDLAKMLKQLDVKKLRLKGLRRAS